MCRRIRQQKFLLKALYGNLHLPKFSLHGNLPRLCPPSLMLAVLIHINFVSLEITLIITWQFVVASLCCHTQNLHQEQEVLPHIMLCWIQSVKTLSFHYIIELSHHNTKLYRKISWVCYRLYCYEFVARVTIQTANKWVIFSPILSYEPSISLHIQTQCAWLIVPDMDSHVTCSTDIYGFLRPCDLQWKINCMQLQGFPIDSHTFVWVRCMTIIIFFYLYEHNRTPRCS